MAISNDVSLFHRALNLLQLGDEEYLERTFHAIQKSHPEVFGVDFGLDEFRALLIAAIEELLTRLSRAAEPQS